MLLLVNKGVAHLNESQTGKQGSGAGYRGDFFETTSYWKQLRAAYLQKQVSFEFVFLLSVIVLSSCTKDKDGH